MKRIFSVDFTRGIAIILMILFNYSVTLNFFRVIDIPNNFLYWFIFPRLIAGIFIFVSGVAAYLAFKKSKKKFRRKYFFRGFKLLIFALLISLFTYIFVPSGTIVFGILHFFALSSFLVPFFIRNNNINVIVGILIILIGIYLQLTTFNFSYLFWLGFMPENFFAFDYFPLIPWIGVLTLGVYFAQVFVKKTAKFQMANIVGKILAFLGKNSLTIYLIHQPILIFILMFFGFRLF